MPIPDFIALAINDTGHFVGQEGTAIVAAVFEADKTTYSLEGLGNNIPGAIDVVPIKIEPEEGGPGFMLTYDKESRTGIITEIALMTGEIFKPVGTAADALHPRTSRIVFAQYARQGRQP